MLSPRRIILFTALLLLLWTGAVAGGALYGWWRTPIAPADDAQGFMRAAASLIEAQNPGNTALVLIENAAVQGEYYSQSADLVTRDTVFATASMSKWIAAWGVMKLVEEKRLDLDRPIDDYLTRWQLPPSAFDNQAVTPRRLLSHTAGLTDGLGFGDYAEHETLPTLEQSLANPRASSGESVHIQVGMEPGEIWQYSGGGYLILELLIEEVAGMPFETFINQSILAPLGMTHSGYHDSPEVQDAVKSYDSTGHEVPAFRHASSAATGFNASAGDMVKFVLTHLKHFDGAPLSPETIKRMRAPHARLMGADVWGLGTLLYAPASDGDFVFGHDGANDPAINVTVRINPVTRDALVVLVTGHPRLASRLGAHWVFWQTGLPDVLSLPAELRRVAPVLLAGAIFLLVGAGFLIWKSRKRV